MRKTHCTIAVRTPMSRTRPARARELGRLLAAGRPNSLTSVAPGAENRSVIWVVIAALWSAASRSQLGQPGAHPPGRQHEDRQQQQRQQGDLPGQAEHHGQREHQRDQVADHAGQRVA